MKFRAETGLGMVDLRSTDFLVLAGRLRGETPEGNRGPRGIDGEEGEVKGLRIVEKALETSETGLVTESSELSLSPWLFISTKMTDPSRKVLVKTR